MTALSLQELRDKARAQLAQDAEIRRQDGRRPLSPQNVDEFSAWSLRWKDPFWVQAWERWRAAQVAWGRVWPGLDWHQYGDVYKPRPEGIVDPTLRAIAQEYLDAREAYHATCDLYPGDAEC